MPKTVTLRLSEDTYGLFRRFAEGDNRPLSNFIETATKRYIEENEFVDEFEMAEIGSNESLNLSLRKGHRDARLKKGRFVK
jgi:predicted transcriptional regulator